METVELMKNDVGFYINSFIHLFFYINLNISVKKSFENYKHT